MVRKGCILTFLVFLTGTALTEQAKEKVNAQLAAEISAQAEAVQQQKGPSNLHPLLQLQDVKFNCGIVSTSI